MQAPRGLRSRTIHAYLEGRGLADGALREAFLHPRLATLTSPDGMVDRQRAAARVATAVRKNEPVVVFGDYDCDGMTSTAIMTAGLRQLGGQVSTCLASRFDGGYGLSAQALARIEASAPGLVITCDCGSSDHQAIAALRGAGVDVIVVDHHLVPSEPLPALAFLNPHRPDCAFPFKWLASCGLVLSLLGQVRSELSRPLELRDYLDLVAIGTVADVAPLEGDNRTLVRAGLQRLAAPARPGVRALLELLQLTGESPVTAGDIAFRIAPRLNAPGRLGAPDLALDLLLAESLTDARVLAEQLDQSSTRRRSEQTAMEQQARSLALAEAGMERAALVLGQDSWNHGIVGIVAGRLAEEFGLPTMVIGFEGEVGRGSVRGPAGFPLYDAVSACREHLVRFGGHQAAAGVTVERHALAELRIAFEAACRLYRDRATAPPAIAGLTLDPADTLPDVLSDLWLLEPCGAGNPLPKLEIVGTVREARSVRGGHLKLTILLPSGTTLSAFGPNLGERGADLRGQVRVAGELRPDRHRGGDAVELLIQNLWS